MSFNFSKKTKSKIFYFVIILLLVTVFNYFYQINYTKKLYTVSLTLKIRFHSILIKNILKMKNMRLFEELLNNIIEPYSRGWRKS